MTITVEQRPVLPKVGKGSVPISIWREVPLWLCGYLSFAIVLLCLLQFHSWLSIAKGSSPDAKNPFATPFYVVDDGYLSILNVSVNCEYLTRPGNYFELSSKVTQRLTFKQRQALPCATSIANNPPIHGSTSLTVTVDYRVAWFPLHRSQTFRLKSVALADGTYLWLEK
jgi:hypothetical protein